MWTYKSLAVINRLSSRPFLMVSDTKKNKSRNKSTLIIIIANKELIRLVICVSTTEQERERESESINFWKIVFEVEVDITPQCYMVD